MWRLALVGLLVGALVVGGGGRALSLDYESPQVPPELLSGAPAEPPTNHIPDTVLLDGSVQGAGAAWTRAGAPGVARYIPGDQWQNGPLRSGCALWNWVNC